MKDRHLRPILLELYSRPEGTQSLRRRHRDFVVQAKLLSTGGILQSRERLTFFTGNQRPSTVAIPART
jgi:hypothetical protein